MPTSDLRQQVSNQISNLELKIADLQKAAQLTTIREVISKYEATVNGFNMKIGEVRNQGYVFDKTLEAKGEDLKNRWKNVIGQLNSKLASELPILQREISKVELEIRQLSAIKGDFSTANSRFPSAKLSMDNFESRVSASNRSFESIYSAIKTETDNFVARLSEITELLRNIQTASFPFLSEEKGIASVKAVWMKTGQEQKDDPEGILFLTDQRLIFEQREEIATKKVLFISTEKKLVQQFCFEIPLSSILSIKSRQTGILKNQDVVDLSLDNAFASTASLHIWQDNEKWKSMINRAKTRDYDLERIISTDTPHSEKEEKLPAQCPKCGVVWNKPLLKGQESYVCEYCGFIHRM